MPDLPVAEARPASFAGEVRVPQSALALTSTRLRTYLVVKRIADVILASAGIVALMPIWLAIALAIRLDSPGRVLFRQKRTGQHGVPFWIWKFRTMRLDAEARLDTVLPLNPEPGHSLIRIPNDPRVTRVGRWLRTYSLDETPQLINILRGEMSMVGPRPISREIADARGLQRLAARPGLTGSWQVSGRKDTDCETMLTLDMEYLECRSLWLDVLILLRTVPVVVGSRGAR
jgi:lipopolysaccharide/colanic/teichoic acid biosynthesis glycosyltransferase